MFGVLNAAAALEHNPPMAINILLATMSMGLIVYGTCEGWSLLDSAYFMMVTWTTVGYGDLKPVTTVGRLFTCLSALIGPSAIMKALSPFVVGMLARLRSALEPLVVLVLDTSDDDMRGYFRAMLGPLILLVLKVSFCWCAGHTFFDSVYFSIITMTTVGYGDFAPKSAAAKALALVFLPLAVGALADCVSEISSIRVRQRIRTMDAARDSEAQSEADFMHLTLVQEALVHEKTLLAIRRKFRVLDKDE